MRTKTRTIALAVSAVFGATALALAGGMFADQGADLGLVASAYAKDEGGASGGHTSGGGEKGGAEKGGAMGGAEKGGGHVSGGSSGGHTSGGSSGGAEKGGGHSSGGDSGHASGAQGSPHAESNRYGLERADHGTKPGHEGHASGVHGANAKHGGNISTYYATGAARTFGGGSGLASLEGVMEGPARFAPGSTLSVTETLQPGPKFTFRYWGGWAVPDDGSGAGGGTVEPTIVDNTIQPAPVGGGGGPLAGLQLNSAARCDGVGANMPTKSFYSNSNLVRLDAARMELDPEAIGNQRGLDPTAMANVQEALVDGKVDPVLVGAYIGMMTRKPVTPEVVKRVAYRLCAPMNDATAQKIAQAANEVNVTASAD